MDRLWEFIEHIVPGLAIVVLAYLVSDGLDHKKIITPDLDLDSNKALLGAVVIGVSYMVGVFNSALCRFAFTESRVMDVVRGRYLKRLCISNPKLAKHVAQQSDYSSFKELDEAVRLGTFATWRGSRAVFHRASGKILQMKDSKLAKEIADRRQEARTLRASIIPLSCFVWLFFGFCVSFFVFLLVVFAYMYREASIADSIEHGV